MQPYEPEYHDWQPARLADRVMEICFVGMLVILACVFLASYGKRTKEQNGPVTVEIETLKGR